MNPRKLVTAALCAAAAATTALAPAAGASDSGAPPAGTVCTWGGTSAAPTGTFSIQPGLTNTPSAVPSAFYVTGDLAGGPGCTGTLTYRGQIDAGASCAVQTFEGRASGIPGVHTFEGVGVTVLGPAQLEDNHGNVVASENAQVATADNAPHFTDCSTPTGFTGGTFSSTIVFTA